jgi:hypothetical protein
MLWMRTLALLALLAPIAGSAPVST